MTAEKYMMENMQGADFQEIESALIGFATLKCRELLEIVAKKAKAEYDLDDDYKVVVNKDSILNAIDLETFCS